MQTPRRAAACAALALVLAGAFAAPAWSQATATSSGQAWPAKPIKLIVPFPAGGGTDIIGRELGQKLATNTGWTVIIDNKPGSGGNLGVDAAAKAPADGYTVVLGQTSNLAINPTLYPKLPYDPVKDLTPVSLVASAPMAIVVAADSPYRTLADLVAAARAKPTAINFATSGNGTVAHLAMEQFQSVANVKMTHVPYKGAAQGVTDLIGGQVQVYVSSVPTLVGHVRNGKMRALAVTSARRTDDLPQVPTVAESYKGFDAVTWFGIAGPAKLPKDVVARLNTEINKALQAPDLLKKLSDQGADVQGGTPEQFGKLVQDDIARWGRLVKASGAKID